MTERERRQRRLLHVRTLQADLAAARLRLLRDEEEKDRRELVELAPLLHLSATPDGTDWVLRCAERELHALRREQLLESIEQRQGQLQAETEEERQRRQEREQVQRLAERTAELCRQQRERVEQARLDDLFSAAGVRLRFENSNDS